MTTAKLSDAEIAEAAKAFHDAHYEESGRNIPSWDCLGEYSKNVLQKCMKAAMLATVADDCAKLAEARAEIERLRGMFFHLRGVVASHAYKGANEYEIGSAINNLAERATEAERQRDAAVGLLRDCRDILEALTVQLDSWKVIPAVNSPHMFGLVDTFLATLKDAKP